MAYYCQFLYEYGWNKGISGISGLNFHPILKANAISECFENLFTHDLRDEKHEQGAEAEVQGR
jgi:hypothetical protein